jgi:integrase
MPMKSKVLDHLKIMRLEPLPSGRASRTRDSKGLYLQCTRTKDDGIARSWVFRYHTRNSPHARHAGFGKYGNSAIDGETSLAEARAKAIEWRKLIKQGLDPLEVERQRDQERNERLAQERNDRQNTFGAVAEKQIKMKSRSRTPRYAAQVASQIEKYCEPIWRKPVRVIDTDDIKTVLRHPKLHHPDDTTKLTATGKRMRIQIEAILNYAATHNMRDAMVPNPARWDGHLENIYTSPDEGKHHAAIPFNDAPAFAADLRKQDGVAFQALEFLTLCAADSGKVREMTWSQIDLAAKTWTQPKRSKGDKPFTIPLSDRAMEIVNEMNERRQGDYVFPGLAVNAIGNAMLRLRPDHTVHGLRSTFRDWASEGEHEDFDHNAVEMCMRHAIPSKVEAAYRRGELMQKRRRIMEAWGNYLMPKTGRGGKVIKLRLSDSQ